MLTSKDKNEVNSITMFSGVGQINMNSTFGKEIYNICQHENIRNVFEVGTWNGQGSTVCVMNALINKNTESVLYSLEANTQQYNDAKIFWENNITNNKLVLLNGILHKEYASESDIKTICNGVIPYISEHYIPEKQMLEYGNIVNIDNINYIDAIILDGGEYTTYGDYKILMLKNPKVICLDDVSVYKCNKIRKDLLVNPDWVLYKENIDDRNGWSIFFHKDYVTDASA